MKSVFLAILLSVTFIGCSTNINPKISMEPPVYVNQIQKEPKKEIKRYEGSLFGRGTNPLFADKKAMKENDIVTVVIDEKTIQLSQGNKKLSSTSSYNIDGGVFSGKAKPLNKLTDIGFKTSSNSNFSGSGTNSRNEKFSTTISARIVKVLNNGNYFISGSRELLINGEKQIIKITGVIRPYDIDQFNTINSKYIADAKILYETEGDIDRTTNEGWGTKIIKSISPF